jgi:uncharacterized protein YqjF (DUF2071 family)
MDRLAPTRRPSRQPQGFQRWHRLLFSHWTVPEAALRPLVPERLTLDTHRGHCYVGVVSFSMQNVKPWRRGPILPGGASFGEINLRTYVHLDGEEPGVFFFSLDAAHRLVVIAARAFWGLPYRHADVEVLDSDNEISFSAQRLGTDVEFAANARIGAPLATATPDSLEFFLCERYQFYAEIRGRLHRARVHHEPYPLHAVTQSYVDDTLLSAAGLPTNGTRTADLFSPGVDVDVYSIERV